MKKQINVARSSDGKRAHTRTVEVGESSSSTEMRGAVGDAAASDPFGDTGLYPSTPVKVTDKQVSDFQRALRSAGYRESDDEAHDILVLNGGYEKAMRQAGISNDRANDARWGEDDDIVDDYGISALVETTDVGNWTLFEHPSPEKCRAYADVMRQERWATQLRRFADTGSVYG